MHEQGFKDRVARLREVNKVIADLDPAIRSSAFELLRGYIAPEATVPPRSGAGAAKNGAGSHNGSGDSEDEDSLLARIVAGLENDEPAHNAKAVTAVLYGRFGNQAFSVDEVRELGDRAGLTVPNRIDMTLSGAKLHKKALYRKVRPGWFAPTVHGEAFLKETFGVTKGKERRTDDDDDE